MSSNSKTTGGGISFFGIVFLILMTLKLAEIGEVADWSWWLITLPLWGPMAIIGVVVILGGIITMIKYRNRDRRFRKRHGLDVPGTPKKSSFQKRLEEMEAKRKALDN